VTLPVVRGRFSLMNVDKKTGRESAYLFSIRVDCEIRG